MHEYPYRTCAEIDLNKLQRNLQRLRALIGPSCQIMEVMKADAYGHGLRVCAEYAAPYVDWFAAATLEEALAVRAAAPHTPILIFGGLLDPEIIQAAQHGLTINVFSLPYASHVQALLQPLDLQIDVHIKVDTGMSRLGYLCGGEMFDTGVEGICHACNAPGLEAEGIFTHFAVADEPDPDSVAYTRRQFDLFCRVIRAVEEKRGRRFPLRHCANTGATACYPEMHLDMVRPGLLLYGYGEFAKGLDLRPVMTLKTTISTTKTYEPGTSVSYGRLFTTQRRTRMGVVPYGYADGFFRCLSGRCSLMTAKGPAPQRGRICMDMSMIDLTDLPGVDVGDEVEIFGPRNPVETMAAQAGTIPYELTCAVSKRVPRVYLQGGKVVEKELLLRM